MMKCRLKDYLMGGEKKTYFLWRNEQYISDEEINLERPSQAKERGREKKEKQFQGLS